MNTDIATLVEEQKTTPAELFADWSVMEKIVSAVESAALAEPSDATTAGGRAKIKSTAFAVSRSKVYLDDIGKAVAAELKEKLDGVNLNRRTVKDRLDALRDRIKQPVAEWESAESVRIGEIKTNIEKISNLTRRPDMHRESSGTLKVSLAWLDDMARLEYGEFEEEARAKISHAEQILNISIETALQREAMADELARLAEQRAAADRRLAELEAENARRLAEQQRADAQQRADEEKRRRATDTRYAAPQPVPDAVEPVGASEYVPEPVAATAAPVAANPALFTVDDIRNADPGKIGGIPLELVLDVLNWAVENGLAVKCG